jgi:hypothetical protein
LVEVGIEHFDNGVFGTHVGDISFVDTHILVDMADSFLLHVIEEFIINNILKLVNVGFLDVSSVLGLSCLDLKISLKVLECNLKLSQFLLAGSFFSDDEITIVFDFGLMVSLGNFLRLSD